MTISNLIIIWACRVTDGGGRLSGGTWGGRSFAAEVMHVIRCTYAYRRSHIALRTSARSTPPRLIAAYRVWTEKQESRRVMSRGARECRETTGWMEYMADVNARVKGSLRAPLCEFSCCLQRADYFSPRRLRSNSILTERLFCQFSSV